MSPQRSQKLSVAGQLGKKEGIDFCSGAAPPFQGGLCFSGGGINTETLGLQAECPPSSPDTHDLPWAEVNTGHLSYKYPFPFQTGVTSNGSILSGWGMEEVGLELSFHF